MHKWGCCCGLGVRVVSKQLKMEQKNKKKLVCCSENDYFCFLFCLEISLRKIIFVKDIYKTLILRQLKTERKSIGEPVPVK